MNVEQSADEGDIIFRERQIFNAALVSVLDKYIFCYRMFFSSASTQPSHERWRKNEGFAYEILAALIKRLCLSLALCLSLYPSSALKSTGVPFSQKCS